MRSAKNPNKLKEIIDHTWYGILSYSIICYGPVMALGFLKMRFQEKKRTKWSPHGKAIGCPATAANNEQLVLVERSKVCRRCDRCAPLVWMKYWEKVLQDRYSLPSITQLVIAYCMYNTYCLSRMNRQVPCFQTCQRLDPSNIQYLFKTTTNVHFITSFSRVQVSHLIKIWKCIMQYPRLVEINPQYTMVSLNSEHLQISQVSRMVKVPGPTTPPVSHETT